MYPEIRPCKMSCCNKNFMTICTLVWASAITANKTCAFNWYPQLTCKTEQPALFKYSFLVFQTLLLTHVTNIRSSSRPHTLHPYVALMSIQLCLQYSRQWGIFSNVVYQYEIAISKANCLHSQTICQMQKDYLYIAMVYMQYDSLH